MTLYPLAIHNNLSPLGINPGFSPAPRLPWRCLPQLAVLLTLPDTDTTHEWPSLGLAVLLPPLALDTTMATMDSHNTLSTIETITVMPTPSLHWLWLPQLSVLLTVPDANTAESWLAISLAVLLPPLALDAAMAEMEGYNDLSALETQDMMPVPSVSMCP